jgi:hypothetical protein
MNTGDRVKLLSRGDALEAGIDENAIGVVRYAYDPPANQHRVDVEFPGGKTLRGWHKSRFVRAHPVD